MNTYTGVAIYPNSSEGGSFKLTRGRQLAIVDITGSDGVRFFGAAELKPTGVFETPYVCLTDQGQSTDWSTKITFSVTTHTPDELFVEGQWIDANGDVYALEGRFT
jgi:hypothetical protein